MSRSADLLTEEETLLNLIVHLIVSFRWADANSPKAHDQVRLVILIGGDCYEESGAL